MAKITLAFTFVLFFAAGLAILISSHYLFYLSIVRFFSISNLAAKHYLLIFLLCLSILFLVASALSQIGANLFVRILYIISSFWIGLFLYLLMACLLIWLATQFFPLSGHNLIILSSVLFILAGIIVACGSWNAFHPRFKNLEIKIANLPAQWEGKTIVQLSDVHLGHIHNANFMEDVTRKVNSVKPDLIVITGDLFDGMDGDLAPMIAPINEMSAPDGIFFVTGNHELYLGLDKVSALLAQTKVNFMKDEVVNLNGLQLVGVNYILEEGSADLGKIIESMSGLVKEQPSILLYHIPTNIEQAQANGIDLQLSGHAHVGQLFPFNFIGRMIYKKYFYGIHQKDDYTLYTTAGVGTWGPPMRIGNQPEITVIKLIKK